MRGLTRLRLLFMAIVAASEIGSGALRAQTMPAAGESDLTLPPDMRAGEGRSTIAPPSRAKLQAHPRIKHKPSGPVSDISVPAPARVAVPDQHPVDLGVTMRGGSGTARAYAPTGDSEVLQESGSAFGAGMKFGF